MSTKAIPIHILTGFLGSGKSTFLTKAIDYYTESRRQPAVIMNEIGEVNLDGLLVGEGVPMEELLSGCVCCTVKGDLTMSIKEMADQNAPDVIFIEASGVANPVEMIDGVTEASLLSRVDLRSIISVIDAPRLLQQMRSGKGKTFRLMQEQIRCGTMLVLNKTDLVTAQELAEVRNQIQEWNPHGKLVETVKCEMGLDWLDEESHHAVPHTTSCSASGCDHPEHDHSGLHHTHEHVMVYTHYLESPVDSEQFEAFISRLPEQVYRAKGIVQFTDTASRFLFQYGYREVNFMRIEPQGDVPNVAVFIGEQIPKEELARQMHELEGVTPSTD